MQLKTPSAPFSHVPVTGDSITIDTKGKVIVLPTGNADILPSHNEYTLNSNRLTIAESPFGGLKGSQAPDYAPGTVFCQTDGVYLTDTSGTNSTKTLTVGKLSELGLLTVDTVAHTITEEFIVVNTATSNNPTVIDACDATKGWTVEAGGGTLSFEVVSGELVATGTADSSSGVGLIKKSIGAVLSGKLFISFDITSTTACSLKFALEGNVVTSWSNRLFSIAANTKTHFIFPLLAPAGSVGMNPASNPGYVPSASTVLYVGVLQGAGTAVDFRIDNICSDVAKSAYIELQTPNNLADTSLQLYTHNGTSYQLCRTCKLDPVWSDVSSTPANVTFLDSTKLDDVYGAGLGRAVYPKGSAGDTKAGSSGNITYTTNLGTDKRIGLRVDLPPSDGGRTTFNKMRIKAVIYYSADANGKRAVTRKFADSTNASYGLQNLTNPWIALYDPTSNLIDFYLFTHRPKNLEFKRDESGNIYELKLYPGNGSIYHGQITHSNLTLDSDSDFIPNCLEASIEGSVTKFLQSYGMVI